MVCVVNVFIFGQELLFLLRMNIVWVVLLQLYTSCLSTPINSIEKKCKQQNKSKQAKVDKFTYFFVRNRITHKKFFSTFGLTHFLSEGNTYKNLKIDFILNYNKFFFVLRYKCY